MIPSVAAVRLAAWQAAQASRSSIGTMGTGPGRDRVSSPSTIYW
jgi:hypothetical protein